MTFLRIVIPLYLLFEHDLRANASRLSRGKTGTHFSGSCSGGARRISRLSAIKPELSVGCMLKKYAAVPRREIDAVRNHRFVLLCAVSRAFGATLVHARVRTLCSVV